MMNAEAPMTGGRTWPDVEATDSIPPAVSPRMSLFIISGIVNEPVMPTLAAGLPLIEPMTMLETTADWAMPERMYFALRRARRWITSNMP